MTKTFILMATLLAFSVGGFAQSTPQPLPEAKLLTKPAPEYPDDALINNITGEVAVEVEVDKKGKVKKARPVGGPEPLHKAAVKAARKARFEPVAVNGRPVNSRASLTYMFEVGGPPCPPGEGGTYRAGELTSKAVIIRKPEPGFTERARKNNVTGKVVLRAVLCRTGEVTGIQVLKALPDGLTLKAILASRKIQFRPAMKDGQPVSQWVVLEYNFNIY